MDTVTCWIEGTSRPMTPQTPVNACLQKKYLHVHASLKSLKSHQARRKHIMSAPSSQELVHAYRHLYRGLLRAVQYSKPARYSARDQLRDAFRKEDPTAFNKAKVERTIEFLRLAAQETGLEHKLVKNLLYTNRWRRRAYQW